MSDKNSSWSDSGYVISERYERHYLREQEPTMLSYAAASQGRAAPDPSLPFRYLDLGCGEGVTVACLAAANPHGEFVAVDFNQEHIKNAKFLVEQAGLTNVTFFQGSFKDFLETDQQPFDYIAAHGIISWVSEKDAEFIFKIATKYLTLGGIFYLCYYVRPGSIWNEVLHRMVQSFIDEQEDDSLSNKVYSGISFAEVVKNCGQSQLFTGNQRLQNKLMEYSKGSFKFNMHELGNKNLVSRFFCDLAENLECYGLEFAASAHCEMNNIANIVSKEHTKILGGLSLKMQQIQSSLLSFESFRWDIFRRPHTLDSKKDDLIDESSFFLDSSTYPPNLPKNVRLNARLVDFETNLNKKIFSLCRFGQMRIGEIIEHVDLSAYKEDDIRNAVQEMVASKYFRPLIKSACSHLSVKGARYRISSKLPYILFDRDFLISNEFYLPSEIAGGAMFAQGFSAFAIREIDGKHFADAMESARKKILDLNKKTQKKLSVDEISTDRGYQRAVLKFRTIDLPLLLKNKILHTI